MSDVVWLAPRTEANLPSTASLSTASASGTFDAHLPATKATVPTVSTAA
eukprot:CAMPEP_0117555078 /NCGR_PEP_ID=MMETSP0784-20121206/51085_1 /TAXON_ID=39447 /ORGANISM="" /LENGTH=48 /DNA_ID= /DNA_START= /DNA_END= /DNA_ORIENTATION=